MIKELTPGEVAVLRERIKKRYAQSPYNGSGFRITQYKDAYQPLADDIARVVPDAAASVTTHRLRKLFYYSDPDVCATDKQEKPSFGDDFVRALRAYAGEEKTLPAQMPDIRRPLSRQWILGALLLVFVLSVLILAARKNKTPKYWKEDFGSTHPDSLKRHGWAIEDFDAAAFSKQVQPNHLTLYTLRGDYWHTPPDTPVISNLLFKKLNGESGKITFKLVNFNPTQNFQQAGLILLNEERDRSHNIRVTLAACASCIPCLQSIQIVKMEHGTAYEKSFPLIRWSDEAPAEAPLREVWIQVQYEKGKFRFFHHTGEEFFSFGEAGSFEFNFQPRYIGIAAFRGIRNDEREWNDSDDIPALFEYVKFEPL